MIPKDPVILLSYVNTQLRDYYESLEALCTCRGIKKKDLISQLDQIDYCLLYTSPSPRDRG